MLVKICPKLFARVGRVRPAPACPTFFPSRTRALSLACALHFVYLCCKPPLLLSPHLSLGQCPSNSPLPCHCVLSRHRCDGMQPPLVPFLLRPTLPLLQVPDGASSSCLVCLAQFSLFNRRHHCRSTSAAAIKFVLWRRYFCCFIVYHNKVLQSVRPAAVRRLLQQARGASSHMLRLLITSQRSPTFLSVASSSGHSRALLRLMLQQNQIKGDSFSAPLLSFAMLPDLFCCRRCLSRPPSGPPLLPSSRMPRPFLRHLLISGSSSSCCAVHPLRVITVFSPEKHRNWRGGNEPVTPRHMRLTSHVTHDASEDEFTEDLREAQRAEEEKRGGASGGASASANAAVRDTRDALVQRGQQLQVTLHVFHHFVPTVFIFLLVTRGQNIADRSQRLQNAAQVSNEC